MTEQIATPSTLATALHLEPLTALSAPLLAPVALTGKELRRLRQRVGLSQRELARRLGYGRSAVCLWENGRRAIPLVQIHSILEILQAARIEQEGWRREIAQLLQSEFAPRAPVLPDAP